MSGVSGHAKGYARYVASHTTEKTLASTPASGTAHSQSMGAIYALVQNTGTKTVVWSAIASVLVPGATTEGMILAAGGEISLDGVPLESFRFASGDVAVDSEIRVTFWSI